MNPLRFVTRPGEVIAFSKACMNARRALWSACLLLAALCGPQAGWASCVRATNSETFVNLDMGSIVVPQDLPVGQTIVTKVFPIPMSGPVLKTFNCINGGAQITSVEQGTAVAGLSYVYTTVVQGVGIRVRLYSQPGPDGGGGFIDAPSTSAVPSTPGSLYGIYNGSSYTVELVKTASETGSGKLLAGPYSKYYGDGDRLSAFTLSIAGSGVTIISPACSVDPASRGFTVPLGNVPLNRFTGVGSAAAERDFSVKLNCSAGVNAQNTIYLSMDGVPDPSSAPGVLKLSSAAGAATGVGILLRDAGKNPVQFGVPAKVGPSMDGTYKVNFTASYYQTGAPVTPGIANGIANFTLSYK